MPLIPPQLSSASNNFPQLAGYYHTTIGGNANFARIAQLDSTNNSFNSRRLLTAPTTSDLIDLVVAFTPWMWSAIPAEAPLPNSVTMAVTVEYPIGTTPLRLTFGGDANKRLTPGFLASFTDPYPYKITAGQQYAIKVYATWTGSFPFILGMACNTNEWTNIGIGLTDQTTNLTVLGNTTAGQGFSGLPLAKLATRIPIVGWLGDSWTAGAADQIDPLYPNSYTIQRAMRNKAPSFDAGVGSYTLASYVAASQGQQNILKNFISHLVIELAVNDMNGGASLVNMQANLQTIIAQYSGRGIKIFGWTPPPVTTSSNGWIDTAGQTIRVAANETVRVAYKNWLLANATSLGLAGVFDAGGIIDPGDLGKWGVDAGTTFAPTTTPAALRCTLSAGVVNGIQFSGTSGIGYPPSTTMNWTATNYPGETGSGALGTVTTNAGGIIVSAVITNGGSLYTAPPMINLLGVWTADGLHGNPRAWNAIIAGTALGPPAFVI